MIAKEDGKTQEAELLKDMHVRVPMSLQQQLPKAKIKARKSIQQIVREALENHLQGMNL